MARIRSNGRKSRRMIYISHRGRNVPGSVDGGPTFNNKAGVGSPVGVVTPDVAEQFYRDTTGNVLWQSTGLTSNDWIRWI